MKVSDPSAIIYSVVPYQPKKPKLKLPRCRQKSVYKVYSLETYNRCANQKRKKQMGIIINIKA
jgi:hypothetical protein